MKKTTVLEALKMNGGDVYSLLGVDRETKMLKKNKAKGTTQSIKSTNHVEKIALEEDELEVPYFNTPKAKYIRNMVKIMMEIEDII